MINLPKPSEISMKNFSGSKSDYILSYLKTLVSALEKVITSGKDLENGAKRCVVDIRKNGSTVKVKYSDGEEKVITL